MQNDLDFLNTGVILPFWLGFSIVNNPLLIKPDFLNYRGIWDKTRAEILENYRNEYVKEYKIINNIPTSYNLTKYPNPEDNSNYKYPNWSAEERLEREFPSNTFPLKPLIQDLNPFIKHKANASNQYIIEEDNLIHDYNNRLEKLSLKFTHVDDPCSKYSEILNNDVYDSSFPVPERTVQSSLLKERQEQGVFITEINEVENDENRTMNQMILAPQKKLSEIPLKVDINKLRRKIAERNKKYAKITFTKAKGKMMGYVLRSSVTVLREKRRDDNIILIQSVYRGYRVRRQYRLNKVTQRHLLQNQSSIQKLHMGSGIVANPDDDEEKPNTLSHISTVTSIEEMPSIPSIQNTESKQLDITAVMPSPDGYTDTFYPVVKEGIKALAAHRKVLSRYKYHCIERDEETKKNNALLLKIYEDAMNS